MTEVQGWAGYCFSKVPNPEADGITKSVNPRGSLRLRKDTEENDGEGRKRWPCFENYHQRFFSISNDQKTNSNQLKNNINEVNTFRSLDIVLALDQGICIDH